MQLLHLLQYVKACGLQEECLIDRVDTCLYGHFKADTKLN